MTGFTDPLLAVGVRRQRLRLGEVGSHGVDVVAQQLLDDARALLGQLCAGGVDGPLVAVDHHVVRARAGVCRVR